MIVQSEEHAAEVQRELQQCDVVAIDTETVGWSPEQGSPIELAQLWCMTVATHNAQYYVPAEFVPVFAAWLGDPRPTKVGANLYGFDSHVFANVGLQLRGILGDVVVMSRLLSPHEKLHGLKLWGERLGFVVRDYAEIVSRPSSKPKNYKRTQRTHINGVPTLRVAGDVSCINFDTPVKMSINELWANYPQRRNELVEYALQDAVMALAVYEHLRRLMERS